MLWLYRIGKRHKIGIFQLPDHIKGLFEPFMPSKYTRTNADIQEAVDMWCGNDGRFNRRPNRAVDRTVAEARYGHISKWDTSRVTSMKNLFMGKAEFNDDISEWDVSAVTNMNSMFCGAAAFNGDLSGWNVSAVTSMNGMFYEATAFNGDLSRWNVSAVTSMARMFTDCPIIPQYKPVDMGRLEQELEEDD